MDSVFVKLSGININEHVEKKEGVSFLAWAWAVDYISREYPDWDYNILKFGEKHLPYVYDENTGYMVFTNITIEGKTREMWLPVMDSKNKSMKKEAYTYSTKKGDKTVNAATMFDINKTIMRCLVKNLAMFGLGLYLYEKEDMPSDDSFIYTDELKNKLENATTQEELSVIYKENKSVMTKGLLEKLSQRKKEIINENN